MQKNLVYVAFWLLVGTLPDNYDEVESIKAAALNGNSSKNPLFIYEGEIDEAPIIAELEFDPESACPNIKGNLYYKKLPEEVFKVKGSCSPLYCDDNYAREEYSKYGDMIELILLYRNKTAAQGQLCQKSTYMNCLQGWLYSTKQTYRIKLSLKEIRE